MPTFADAPAQIAYAICKSPRGRKLVKHNAARGRVWVAASRRVCLKRTEFSAAGDQHRAGARCAGDGRFRWCERSELGFSGSGSLAAHAGATEAEIVRPYQPKSTAPTEGRSATRVAYPEVNGAALDLAAYRARSSELSWRSADRSQPVCISVGTHRRVRLGLAFPSVRCFSFPAQFLHAGPYCHEVVGSTRSVHGVTPYRVARLLAQCIGRWPAQSERKLVNSLRPRVPKSLGSLDYRLRSLYSRDRFIRASTLSSRSGRIADGA